MRIARPAVPVAVAAGLVFRRRQAALTAASQTTSVTLATSLGSVENVNVWDRQGAMP